ncbi:MAG: MFS transporter [Bacteroidales bacterium]
MYNKRSVFIAACIGIAFFGVAFIVMGGVLPALTQKYDLNSIEAASLVTFLPIGILLGSLVFGPVVDRYGYRSLLIVSIAVEVAGLCGLSFFDHRTLLRFCIFLIGWGGGMLNGSTNALVADISDDRNRSSRLSILGACYGVGALLIPVLLASLSRRFSYETILLGCAVILLLSIVYFAAIRFPRPSCTQGIPVRQMFGLVRQPLILMLSLFLFFQSGLEGLFNNWTTTYLAATGTALSAERIVFSLTFVILGMTLMRLALSKLLGMFPHFRILTASSLLTILGLLLLKYATGYGMVAIALFCCGAGLAAGFPVIIGLIGSLYRDIPGSAIGFALFIALSGNSLLNYLIGFTTELFGIGSFPFSLIIILLLQSVILFKEKRIINTNS